MEYYKKARWDQAVKMFETALELNPDDICSKMYKDRCLTLKANPPKGKWDGVWVMKSK